MRVVVVGGSSFLGSWTVRALAGSGTAPTILARPSSDLWRLDGLDDVVEVRRRHPAEWGSEIALIRPDVILSLDWAGVAGADKNDPAQWRNLDRLRDILTAARNAGVRRFVGVGSQAEYGPQSGVITEMLEGKPVTEYGRAKLAAHHLLKESAGDLEWAWARVFSTYGPLDNQHWLLPGVAIELLRGAPVPLSGGDQRWSYLYGPDAGAAFAALALAPSASGVINVGSPEAPRLRDTIEQFSTHFPGSADLQFGAIPYGPSQVMHLQPDTTRMEQLGWHESTSLESGLRDTARWLQGKSVDDPFNSGRYLPRCPYLPSGLATAN